MVSRHCVTEFGKGATIPCTLCLVAKHHSNAVSAIIMLIEYKVISSLIQQLLATSLWEALAVLFGIAYLLLAMREHIWCWYAAFLGTAISIYVFWDASLLMESALNVYYVIMAVYGWYQWRHGGKAHSQLAISRWPLHYHGLAITGVLVVACCSGPHAASRKQAATATNDRSSMDSP